MGFWEDSGVWKAHLLIQKSSRVLLLRIINADALIRVEIANGQWKRNWFMMSDFLTFVLIE